MTLGFLRGQAAFLRAHGIEVAAVASPGVLLAQFGTTEGVACFAVPMARAITPLSDAVSLLRLWRIFRRLRPDVVDAHTPKGGLLGVTAAWLARVPARVYHLHGLRFETATGMRRRVLRAADAISARLATRVLCVSRSLAEAAAAESVAPRSKLHVLGPGSINGVDATRFRPPDRSARVAARAELGIPADARVVGFVGRRALEKGIVELAEAWRSLRDELPDAWLVILGPEEPTDPIPGRVAAALAADPRVRTFDFDGDTTKYYRAMDVFVLPTYREGFGVVTLEAAATGLPVVATRVTGCVDAVEDGVTGTLVPPRDAGAIVAALRAYLTDPALAKSHGEAGRARVLRQFDQERIWAALRDEYLALAGRGGSARADPGRAARRRREERREERAGSSTWT
jgi:glycosyltransferase involved in cell wall biosynthesis